LVADGSTNRIAIGLRPPQYENRPTAPMTAMAVDHIRYDLLTQQALRGVVRTVLADIAKKGLPGDHHFYISFDTHAEGLRLSSRMRAQYPDEMTIVLQHQFWDLVVTDETFEVGLSFGGVPERLLVPFEAVTAFVDPSVEFGLRFEPASAEGDEEKRPVDVSAPLSPVGNDTEASPPRQLRPAPVPAPSAVDEAAPAKDAPASPTVEEGPDKPTGGGEVVRLDRFRKK
jgi:uncharacterized protein